MDSILQDLLTEEAGILRLGGSRMALLDIEAGFWGLRRQMEALVGRQLTDNMLQQAGVNAGASFARTYDLPPGKKGSVDAFRDCVAAYQASGFGQFEVNIEQWPLGSVQVIGRDAFEAWMTLQHNQKADRALCFYTAGVFTGFINTITGREDVVCIQHTCQAEGSDCCYFELLLASEAESTRLVKFDPDPGVPHSNLSSPEARSESDTRELSTLLDISQSIASTLELEPLLDLILNQFKALVDYDGAAVLTLDGDTLTVLAYRGPIAQEEALALRFPGDQAGVNQLVIQQRQALIIPDIRDDAPLAQAFRATAGARLGSTFSYLRSWMGVPLITRDKVIGMLSLDHSQPNAYNQRHSLLARTFADKVAAAIENARLYQQEYERRCELQTLLDVAAAAGSSLDLEEMLRTTLDRLVDLVGASRSGVLLLDEDTGELRPYLLRPERPVPPEAMDDLLHAAQGVVSSGKLLYVTPDREQDMLEPGAFLPLRIRDKVIGLMGIIGAPGEDFRQEQLALFQSIADQVAVAMENARLYEQAEQAAAVRERDRLARELHDAVSQTLFSASLIAEVLPRLWENDPTEGRRRLEELHELTRGALAEMRALLMELRPSALAEFTLADLLQQLAEAATGRSRLPIELIVEGQQPLPPEVKIAFYRIAQEALHNISKHAGARLVTMRLQVAPAYTELVIADDGRGFDVADIPPNSLGLGIMRERADQIGANFRVESQIGEGTTVTVRQQRGIMDDE